MIGALLRSIAVAAVLVAGGDAFGAERLAAEVDCRPTNERLVFDCAIELTGRESGRPVPDARIVVNADMPAMPMAHNVRPVSAEPGDRPGLYHARLHLEMPGEWALRLRIEGPARDMIVVTRDFGGSDGHGGGPEHGSRHRH